MSATDLLRDYWFLMPIAIVLDALVLGGMAYGVWRALYHWGVGK